MIIFALLSAAESEGSFYLSFISKKVKGFFFESIALSISIDFVFISLIIVSDQSLCSVRMSL